MSCNQDNNCYYLEWGNHPAIWKIALKFPPMKESLKFISTSLPWKAGSRGYQIGWLLTDPTARYISNLITVSSSLSHYSWSKAALFLQIKKQNCCFRAVLGRGRSTMAASVPHVATWWRPQVQNGWEAGPLKYHIQSACKEDLETRPSLVLQTPSFVQIQPGPALVFKESPKKGQQAKRIFKPAIGGLVLHGLKSCGSTILALFKALSIQRENSGCCLPPVALHWSAIQWKYFLPSLL